MAAANATLRPIFEFSTKLFGDAKVAPTVGTFPIAEVSNGHTFFVQRLHEIVGVPPRPRRGAADARHWHMKGPDVGRARNVTDGTALRPRRDAGGRDVVRQADDERRPRAARDHARPALGPRGLRTTDRSKTTLRPLPRRDRGVGRM